MQTMRVPGCVRRPCEGCLQPCIHLLLQLFTRAAEAGSQEGSSTGGECREPDACRGFEGPERFSLEKHGRLQEAGRLGSGTARAAFISSDSESNGSNSSHMWL